MLHKVLVFVRYEIEEYLHFLEVYLKEDDEIIGIYPSNEIEDCFHVLEHRFGSQDRIDLYLVQDQDARFWDAPKELEENKIWDFLCDQSTWEDEDAYEILMERFGYMAEETALAGKERQIGDWDRAKFRLRCDYPVAKKDGQANFFTVEVSMNRGCNIMSRDRQAEPDGQNIISKAVEDTDIVRTEKHSDDTPSLAEMMRELSRGR